MLGYMIELMGANCIALGSDYPCPLGEQAPGKMIEAMNLDPAVRDRLLAGTALEWLDLARQDFE
jgi:aminocarboxymuconate-semialdehyde decarboxylase